LPHAGIVAQLEQMRSAPQARMIYYSLQDIFLNIRVPLSLHVFLQATLIKVKGIMEQLVV
jgi:hypothetical protein